MRLILILLLMLAAVIFAVQNAMPVGITLLAWRLEASLAIIVVACVALGVIGGVLLVTPRLYRMKTHERELRAKLAHRGGDTETAVTAPPPANVASQSTRQSVSSQH